MVGTKESAARVAMKEKRTRVAAKEALTDAAAVTSRIRGAKQNWSAKITKLIGKRLACEHHSLNPGHAGPIRAPGLAPHARSGRGECVLSFRTAVKAVEHWHGAIRGGGGADLPPHHVSNAADHTN